MWHSEADIINDLAALNDFGEPGDTEPYKILCSVGRGSKAKKESQPQPKTILDPRTGEEIEVSGDYLSVEDILCRGIGRGSVFVSKNYTSLQKQLRLARPFGSSDEVIESYYKKDSPNKDEASPDIQSKKLSEDKSSAQTKPRVKAVRNSNFVKNALMASLLKSKEMPPTNAATEESIVSSEAEVLGTSVKDCDFQNGEVATNDSHSNNSLSGVNSEDATSESLCNSKINLGEETERSGEENFKSCSVDLSEDFNSNLSFSAEDEEFANSLGKENGIRNILFYEDVEESDERIETYKQLGERLNNVKSLRKQKSENQFFFLKGPRNKTLGSQAEPNFKSFPEDFMYEESNFPPLA